MDQILYDEGRLAGLEQFGGPWVTEPATTEIGETGKVTGPQIEPLERMIGSREDSE
jgi:hypothetical protein